MSEKNEPRTFAQADEKLKELDRCKRKVRYHQQMGDRAAQLAAHSAQRAQFYFKKLLDLETELTVGPLFLKAISDTSDTVSENEAPATVPSQPKPAQPD